MRILLSNDDGYFAPGLAALAEGLAPLGEITVVAPERDRSGASNSLTLDRPLHALRARHNGFLYVNGTPDRLRAHGRHGPAGLRARRRRLRHQHRLQHGRRHALFGHRRRGHRGLPAGHPVDRGLAGGQGVHALRDRGAGGARAGRAPRARALRRPGAAQRERARRALRRARRASRSRASAAATRRSPWSPGKNPRGETVYWVGPAGAAREAGPGTDFNALERGAVSVTPLQVDLTHAGQIPLVSRMDRQAMSARRHRHDLGAHAPAHGRAPAPRRHHRRARAGRDGARSRATRSWTRASPRAPTRTWRCRSATARRSPAPIIVAHHDAAPAREIADGQGARGRHRLRLPDRGARARW